MELDYRIDLEIRRAGHFSRKMSLKLHAGTVVFGIVGGAVAVGAAGVAAVPIGEDAIGITVGAGLYSGGCGIKALWNKLT